jgi:hypothetical protein
MRAPSRSIVQMWCVIGKKMPEAISLLRRRWRADESNPHDQLGRAATGAIGELRWTSKDSDQEICEPADNGGRRWTTGSAGCTRDATFTRVADARGSEAGVWGGMGFDSVRSHRIERSYARVRARVPICSAPRCDAELIVGAVVVGHCRSCWTALKELRLVVGAGLRMSRSDLGIGDRGTAFVPRILPMV